MLDSAEAHAIGLVDELAAIDDVATRARIWLEGLIALPREPMLRTRAISRADVVAAMQPERIQLESFIDAWTAPDTQQGLKALIARLGK
jgi:enoyl-CoA hydratase/carnithine racemase